MRIALPGLLALTLGACRPAALVPPPGGTPAPEAAAPAPGTEAPGRPVDPAQPSPGTGAPNEPGDAEEAASPSEPTLRRVGSWTRSPFETRERRRIRDQAELDRIWQQLGAEGAPTINWESDIVILVAAGRQSSGGHGVTVSGATAESGRLEVEVVTTAPGPNCVTTTALTQPAEIVAVRAPGIRGDPRFTERREAREC